MGRGQWRLDDALIDQLNEIDTALDDDINRGDASDFREHLAAMHQLVIDRGSPIPAEEIVPSDAFVPPVDVSIDELRKLWDPDGLIPGGRVGEAIDG
jgi:hypothetical protein